MKAPINFSKRRFLKRAITVSVLAPFIGLERVFAGIGDLAFWRKKTAAGSWSATISANQKELNLRTWALANGWNGTSAASITVAANVYIWSDNLAASALTIDGLWPGGITLINKGYIIGRGGDSGGTQNGSDAINIQVNLTCDSSSGYICGGGGAGGSSGGGGAGGGIGGAGEYPGGAGGACGAAGANGTPGSGGNFCSGGGGGRIVPGAGGSGGSYPYSIGYGGGAGGGGASLMNDSGAGGGGYGAAGGSGGANGGNGSYATGNGKVMYDTGGGGGGGWGAMGGSTNSVMGSVPGGVGGKAINLNGKSVTWVGGFPSVKIYGGVS